MACECVPAVTRDPRAEKGDEVVKSIYAKFNSKGGTEVPSLLLGTKRRGGMGWCSEIRSRGSVTQGRRFPRGVLCFIF